MARTGRIVVVGLGPAGADLVLPAARTALGSASRAYVRTARHPAVEELREQGLSIQSFDDEYARGTDLEAVYRSIVEQLLGAAAEHGEIVYGVPGSPVVAERTIVLLREAADSGRVELETVPGLSFADLAWARLGVDPLDGAQVADARSVATDGTAPAGPLLFAQCDSALVLSDLKLALLEELPPAAPVTVLRHLGLADEQIVEVELAELDRVIEPDHLTSVFVDTGQASVAREVSRLVALAERLRAPGGCPWDAEQSHHSLTRYLLEEAYETVETIEDLPAGAPEGEPDLDAYARLEDELGDLLYQIVFHAILAREAGAFTIADVARGVHDKLVRRHPHVFGDVHARTVDDVMTNWEQIKKEEKGTDSIVEGISPGLASLLYANKLYRKAASIGLQAGTADEGIDRAADALSRLREGDGDPDETGRVAVGDLLAAAIVIARARGVDAETALRSWIERFRDRFVRMETLARDRGVDLARAEPGVVAGLWVEATLPSQGAAEGRR
jgi:tetrapyrrole methylase family protein/MazG family protein